MALFKEKVVILRPMKQKCIKRKVTWTIILILLIGLGLWAYSRWNVWFHNPEEEPYYDIFDMSKKTVI